MLLSYLLNRGPRDSFPNEATFVPTTGSEEELLQAAYVASLQDLSQLGQAIRGAALNRLASLAQQNGGRSAERESDLRRAVQERHAFVREGTLGQIEPWVGRFGGMIRSGLRRIVSQVEARGGVAIVVASERADLGVVCFNRGARK